MFRLTTILLTAAATAASAAPAAAQSADQDARCLLVSNVFSRTEKDETRRHLAEAARFYFMGRAAVRLSPAQLKAQLQAQAKSLQTQAAGTAMNACAKQFQAKEQELEAIGADLQRGQARAK
jgi:NAD/NADP transhydrogenase alpha subunit